MTYAVIAQRKHDSSREFVVERSSLTQAEHAAEYLFGRYSIHSASVYSIEKTPNVRVREVLKLSHTCHHEGIQGNLSFEGTPEVFECLGCKKPIYPIPEKLLLKNNESETV